MPLTFALQPNPAPAPDARVAEVLANPGFGTFFTDHMAVAQWTKGQGWHDDGVRPYGPLSMDPASAVFHYAQEIFEGLKAYRHADGSVWLFRPDANAARFVKEQRGRIGHNQQLAERVANNIHGSVSEKRRAVGKVLPVKVVSIHALRFQRAMHNENEAVDKVLSFQSTPSVSRGRCFLAANTL